MRETTLESAVIFFLPADAGEDHYRQQPPRSSKSNNLLDKTSELRLQ